MIISYIRPDKDFDNIYEQLSQISTYCERHALQIDKELVDQSSLNKRIQERHDVVTFFRSLKDDVLVVSDAWTLSSNIEDIVQMLSCLLRNGMTIHLVKPGLIIDRTSDTMVVLGIIDQLRQMVQQEDRKGIGRPKGSRSSSKFDPLIDQILLSLKANMNVSSIARELGVSRTSLKDYIESRELKELISKKPLSNNRADAEEMIVETIKCPVPDTLEEIA